MFNRYEHTLQALSTYICAKEVAASGDDGGVAPSLQHRNSLPELTHGSWVCLESCHTSTISYHLPLLFRCFVEERVKSFGRRRRSSASEEMSDDDPALLGCSIEQGLLTSRTRHR